MAAIIFMMEVLRRILLILLIVFSRFTGAQGDCNNIQGFELSFTRVLTDAVHNSGFDLSAIFEFLTVFKPRGASFDCEPSFRPDPWPQNVIPYVILNGFSTAAHHRILADLQHVGSSTCLTFVPRDQQQHYVVFQPSPQYCFMTMRALYNIAFAEPVIPGFAPRPSFPTHTTVDGGPSRPVYSILLPIEYVERAGVLGEIVGTLGFSRQEVRFDRDYFEELIYDATLEMFQHAFRKNVPTVLDTLFPFDPASVTHLSLAEARRWNISLRAKQPETVFRDDSEHKLSQIDIKKIQYLYCNRTTPATLAQSINSSMTAAPSGGGPGNILDATSTVAEEVFVSQPPELVNVEEDLTLEETQVLATSGAAGWRLQSLLVLAPLVISVGTAGVMTGTILQSFLSAEF